MNVLPCFYRLWHIAENLLPSCRLSDNRPEEHVCFLTAQAGCSSLVHQLVKSVSLVIELLHFSSLRTITWLPGTLENPLTHSSYWGEGSVFYFCHWLLGFNQQHTHSSHSNAAWTGKHHPLLPLSIQSQRYLLQQQATFLSRSPGVRLVIQISTSETLRPADPRSCHKLLVSCVTVQRSEVGEAVRERLQQIKVPFVFLSLIC